MRETRQSGSEGGAAQTNAPFLPLSGECGSAGGEVAGREASASRRVRLRRWGGGRPGGQRSQGRFQGAPMLGGGGLRGAGPRWFPSRCRRR